MDSTNNYQKLVAIVPTLKEWQVTIVLKIVQLLQIFSATANNPDDTPKEKVLDGLYNALWDVKEGRISPVETLWDGDNDA